MLPRGNLVWGRDPISIDARRSSDTVASGGPDLDYRPGDGTPGGLY